MRRTAKNAVTGSGVNFIVIGAAKAGTTALHGYLAEHPQVFMSGVKETNYFAYEVDANGHLVYGDPVLHRFPIRTPEAYAGLFAGAGDAIAIGEASPIYLECPTAAARMRASLPRVRLVCGLRHPVDRAYSDYLMYLRSTGRRFDPERDLSATAEWMHPDSHWMRVSCYHDALARYFDKFPREQLHVFLFDDLKRDARGVMREIQRFLGVDPEFVPDLSTPYNVGGVPGNMLLERVIMSGAAVRTRIEPLIPLRATKWLRRLRAANMQKPPRLPAELRARLTMHFRDDIARTAALIGRNLDHWLDGELRRAG